MTMKSILSVCRNRGLAVSIGLAVCSVAVADTELQWTGAAGNGYIDDKDNWGGTYAPIYDSTSDGYYGNFRFQTGKTLSIGVSADVRLDRLYFQNTQNATFNFDFTGHTVSFQGFKNYPFSTHNTCSGNIYNFLGGTFCFDGQRHTISFSDSSATVTLGSNAVLSGRPEFLFSAKTSSGLFKVQPGYQGRFYINANADTSVIVEGVDRSTSITNQKDNTAWKLSGDVDFGSACLGGCGLWTGYGAFGHRQSISNAFIDVQGTLGHGYTTAASNNFVRIFAGTEMILQQPGNTKYAYAAGYQGCSNAVEIAGVGTQVTLVGTDWTLAGIACGVMGDRNFLHITDRSQIDIGNTSLMIGNPKGLLNRGRSVGNRIVIDGGARVSSGPIWVGCAANRNDRAYNGTQSDSHTYNWSADGTPTTDADMTIAVSSNAVVFAGHTTTGVVGHVYVSVDTDYRLPTLTDANGVEVRDGATVQVSGNVSVGLQGEDNYLTVANGGCLEANTLTFGANSVLNFVLTDDMSTEAPIRTRNADYNLVLNGAPRIVIDTTELTANRVQTLLATRTAGKTVNLDDGALATMNANLQVIGRGTAELVLQDAGTRLVARLRGMSSGMAVLVR
jgi:hypothetical protein